VVPPPSSSSSSSGGKSSSSSSSSSGSSGSSSSSSSGGGYTVTAIPGAGTDCLGASGPYYGSLNNGGEVAIGASDCGAAWAPFTWTAGVMTTLPLTLPNQGTNGTRVNGINDSGTVVGTEYTTAPFISDGILAGAAVVWSNGVETALPDLGTGAYAGYSTAIAINNAGMVVGTSIDNSGQYDLVIWSAGGVATDLGLIDGGPGAGPAAINNLGEIVGAEVSSNGNAEAAILWENGSPISLGGLDVTCPQYSPCSSVATAINDAGVIVGSATATSELQPHAVVWVDTVATDLGTLPGDSGSQAQGINASGAIVGCSTNTVYPLRAVLWPAGGGAIIDLNSELPGTLASAGWVLSCAIAINDQGWILAVAYNTVVPDSMNPTNYFLLVPN
jgi:probable HAF family extracellular repeat protein